MNELELTPATQRADRLRQYARCLTLLADQLDAVEQSHAERVRALAEERSCLEESLLRADEGDPAGDALVVHLQKDLGEALSELEERLDADRWTEEQWNLLSEGAMRSAREVPVARPGVRTYPVFAAPEPNLDRRF